MNYVPAIMMPLGETREREREATSNVTGPQSIQSVLSDVLALLADPLGPSLPTGFRDFDWAVGGLRPGHLMVVSGRPSMGRTSFVLGIALNVACTGSPVAVYSPVLSSDELERRLLSALSRVDHRGLRGRRLAAMDWEKTVRAAAIRLEAPLSFVDHVRSGPSLSRICAEVERLTSSEGELGLLVLDDIDRMVLSEGYDEVALLSRGLKRMARALGVPVVVTASVVPAVELRVDKRPRIGDLGRWSVLGEVADVVVGLHREERDRPEERELRGLAEVFVSKNRHGAPTRVLMAFLAEFGLFADLAHEESKTSA